MKSVIVDIKNQLSDKNTLLWFPNLTAHIINNLNLQEHLNLDSYTTASFLGTGLDVSRLIYTFDPKEEKITSPHFRIEFLPPALNIYFSQRGLNLYSSDIDEKSGEFDVLRQAADLIGQAPSLATTISYLVKSIHLVCVPDPLYDISFSDPKIPFSIFISVPPSHLDGALRTAEAIIHESMHLQLSLIERYVDLSLEPDAKYYSPWKKELRPVTGLLHALYVFAVIEQWFDFLPKNEITQQYISRRRSQLKDEVEQVDILSCQASLTPEGRQLLNNTINTLRAYQR